MKSLVIRACAARVALWLILAIQLAALYVDATAVEPWLQPLGDPLPDPRVDPDPYTTVLTARDAVALAQLFAVPVCALAFCTWLAGAYANLVRAGVPGLHYSAAGAALRFFVPVLNLFEPFIAMREVWSGSSALARGSLVPGPPDAAPRIVGAWWALLLLFLPLHASGRVTLLESQVALLADLLSLAAACLAVRFVSGVSALQSQARERARAPAPGHRTA